MPHAIYVAGPYYPYDEEHGTPEFKKALSKNVRAAENAGKTILKKGHVPFIPHTMMKNWEDRAGIKRSEVYAVCSQYVRISDALLYMASSKGADQERKLARTLNIPIYTKLK